MEMAHADNHMVWKAVAKQACYLWFLAVYFNIESTSSDHLTEKNGLAIRHADLSSTTLQIQAKRHSDDVRSSNLLVNFQVQLPIAKK
ncbi:hypothetical protein N7475_007603 [Penicillium sp. IBT 31633x]|nr:hypothetical protein N7475_007603 [Penicillium sp. IBT 31633x]